MEIPISKINFTNKLDAGSEMSFIIKPFSLQGRFFFFISLHLPTGISDKSHVSVKRVYSVKIAAVHVQCNDFLCCCLPEVQE